MIRSMCGAAILVLATGISAGAQGLQRSSEAIPDGPVEATASLIAHASERSPGGELPLDGRIAVVLVHGYGPIYNRLPGVAGVFTWTGLTQAIAPHRELLLPQDRRMKLFHYNYRPVLPYPELAATFADTVVEQLLEGPKPARKVIFVAHSAGALMSRYAAADPRIFPHVAGILTLAGIHRGSVQASLVAAHGLDTREGVQTEDLELLATLRLEAGISEDVADPGKDAPCSEDPACAVIASLAFDNFDGSISDTDVARHGMLVNHALAEFNRTDPNLHRTYTYHGLVTDLGTESPRRPILGRLFSRRGDDSPPVPTEEELQRRLLERIHPSWSTADPLVTWESGTFSESVAPVASRHGYPEVDHRAILWTQATQVQLASDLMALVTLASNGREHLLLENVRRAPGRPIPPPNIQDPLPSFDGLSRSD